MVFFGVKIIFFATSCRDIIFFLQNRYFLRHKVLTEYFFLPISETEFFFSIKFADSNFPPKKNIAPPFQVKWMFPYGTFKYFCSEFRI